MFFSAVWIWVDAKTQPLRHESTLMSSQGKCRAITTFTNGRLSREVGLLLLLFRFFILQRVEQDRAPDAGDVCANMSYIIMHFENHDCLLCRKSNKHRTNNWCVFYS